MKTNKSFIKTTSHPIKAELRKVYKISVSMKILTAVNQEKFFAQFVVVSTWFIANENMKRTEFLRPLAKMISEACQVGGTRVGKWVQLLTFSLPRYSKLAQRMLNWDFLWVKLRYTILYVNLKLLFLTFFGASVLQFLY